MVTAESRRGRRVVGALDRGTDLFDGLRGACTRHGVRAGELRAVGALERIELRAFDQERRRWQPSRVLAGSLELLSLTGNVSEQAGSLVIAAHATLMRDRDAGMELLGGHVVAARVFSVEFVIETFDDLVLRRTENASLGLAVWTEAIGEPSETPPAPRAAVPAVPVIPVASPPDPFAVEPPQRPAAPAAKPRDDREEHDIRLAAGDVIVHPRFRRCVVQRVEGDNEFVQVQLRNGRIVRLSLEILHLRPQGTENGQRVFEAEIDE